MVAGQVLVKDWLVVKEDIMDTEGLRCALLILMIVLIGNILMPE